VTRNVLGRVLAHNVTAGDGTRHPHGAVARHLKHAGGGACWAVSRWAMTAGTGASS
jgi:hypothetical protein